MRSLILKVWRWYWPKTDPTYHEHCELEDLYICEFRYLASSVKHILQNYCEKGHIKHHEEQNYWLEMAIKEPMKGCSGHVDIGSSDGELRSFIDSKYIREIHLIGNVFFGKSPFAVFPDDVVSNGSYFQ